MTQKPSSKSLVPFSKKVPSSKALISLDTESGKNRQKQRPPLEFEDIQAKSDPEQIRISSDDANAFDSTKNIHQQNIFESPPSDFGFGPSQEAFQFKGGEQKERQFKVLVAVLGTIVALSLFFYLMYLLDVSQDDNRPNFLRLLF